MSHSLLYLYKKIKISHSLNFVYLKVKVTSTSYFLHAIIVFIIEGPIVDFIYK